MDYFLERENVESYTKMVENTDNTFVLGELKKVLMPGSTLLELGMGPGLDLLEMANDYKVVGSDYSPFFIENFKSINDHIDVLVLDALTMEIDKKFDCIYSNKVMVHFTKEELSVSLIKQCEHLNPQGIVFMTIWKDSYNIEKMYDGQLTFVYYEENDIKSILPDSLELVKTVTYGEFEPGDSMVVVLRKKLVK